MANAKIKNMEEFASKSGISRPTVSKYFNDPSSVRASTRARIENALERYDYTPNVYAVNQNRRLTKTVGIVVPYLADPFFAEIARVIEQRCIQSGFRPILFSSHGDQALEKDNLDSLRALKPAGALLAPLGLHSDKRVIEAFCEHVPTVLFDSNIEGMGEAFIGSNSHQSVEEMISYLCRTGEPPCFFEMKNPPNPNADRLENAYLTSMERHGETPHMVQVEGDGWDFEAIGYREGLRIIGQRGFATNTVLCSNDRLAIGLLAAAYEKGLRVGRGSGFAMRIAGHDDHPFARFTCPPLTTMAQNVDAIAERSVAALFSLFETPGRKAERETTLFDVRLVIRESA